MSTTRKRLVVCGAGPAGTAAAVLGRRWFDVIVIDEHERPGGQYWRGRSRGPAWASPSRLGGAADLRYCGDTQIVDASQSGALGCLRGDGALTHEPYDALVIAGGAYDRSVAVPGWTLPGVTTAGASLTMAREHGVSPGRNVVIAGAGLLLFALAAELRRLGSAVTIVDASSLGTHLQVARRALADATLIEEVLALRVCNPLGVSWKPGHIVTAIRGHERVRSVEVSSCDSDWRPRAGTTTEIEADAVCLGFGLIPHFDIACSLGCEIRRLQDTPDFGVRVDDGQRTSVDGVYGAGETTGIGGARLSAFEGYVAALTAAFDHGLLDSRTYTLVAARARARMQLLQGLADALRRAYAPRDGAWLLADNSTIVCRCEEVAVSTVVEALGETDSSVLAIKAMTRLGMGPCQGRVCMPSMIERLRITHGRDPSQQLGLWRVRQPLRPILLKALADVADGAW